MPCLIGYPWPANYIMHGCQTPEIRAMQPDIGLNGVESIPANAHFMLARHLANPRQSGIP